MASSTTSPREAGTGSPDGLHKNPKAMFDRVEPANATHDTDAGSKERRVEELMREQMSMPMTVHGVEVHGAKDLRRGFLDPLIKPLVSDDQVGPSTVGEVMLKLQRLSGKLSALQILREAPEVGLWSAAANDATAGPTDTNISVALRPLSRFKLQTGTDVGNGEGSAFGSLLWRNMFGGAEMLTLNAKAGTRTRSAYSANLSTPVMSDPDMRISLEALASAVEKPWASHEEVIKGGSVRFSWLNAQRDTYTMEYTGAWRQVTGLGQNASPTVRQDAGDSIKSALKNTFYRERRDNPQLPQSGYMFRSAWEMAGVGPLGGHVAFSKSETEASGAIPIPLPGVKGPSGISIGGGLRMGMLWPLPLGFDFGGKAAPSRLNDRFQLGGPTDVRGFKLGGLGPHDGQDSVGGDVFAAGSVNMLLPLPYKGPDSGLRFQLFANGGRLVSLQDPNKSSTSKKEGTEGSPSTQGLSGGAVQKGIVNAVGELLSGAPSMAAGVGMVYAHPVARFELNFSLPLVMRRGEVSTKGLQMGVGINFL